MRAGSLALLVAVSALACSRPAAPAKFAGDWTPTLQTQQIYQNACVLHASFDAKLGCRGRDPYQRVELFADVPTKDLLARSAQGDWTDSVRVLVMLARRQDGDEQRATYRRVAATVDRANWRGMVSVPNDVSELAAEAEDALIAADLRDVWADGSDTRCPVTTSAELWSNASPDEGKLFAEFALLDEIGKRVAERIHPHDSHFWAGVAAARVSLFPFQMLHALDLCTEDNVTLLDGHQEFLDRRAELIGVLERTSFRSLTQAIALSRVVNGQHEVFDRAEKAASALRQRMGEQRALQFLWLTDDPTDPRKKRALAPFIDVLAPL